MERNILAVGDVVAPAGVKYCKAALPRLRRELSVDFCVVNGENAAVLGMLPAQAEELLSAGADVITMGNHTWGRRELVPYLERSREVLRPANLPQQQPGRGWGVFETPFGDVAVIDLIGRCGMDYTPDNPFQLVERIVRKIQTKLILVELHAEATASCAARSMSQPISTMTPSFRQPWPTKRSPASSRRPAARCARASLSKTSWSTSS